jgi:hypothetical protein
LQLGLLLFVATDKENVRKIHPNRVVYACTLISPCQCSQSTTRGSRERQKYRRRRISFLCHLWSRCFGILSADCVHNLGQ